MTRTSDATAGRRLGSDGVTRCAWCGDAGDYVAYHDAEWGVPVIDDTRLFEKLSLEGFQAGLSWITILRKRESFRRAFAGFDPAALRAFGARDVRRLLADAAIVRHRGKIEAVLNNAQRYPELCDEFGSLAAFVWGFEPAPTERPRRIVRGTIPSAAPTSVAMSKALKQRGWRFVGPTTMYALFQAMGVVNDHVEGCARRPKVESLRFALARPVRSGR